MRVSHQLGGFPGPLVRQLDKLLPSTSPSIRISLQQLILMVRNLQMSSGLSQQCAVNLEQRDIDNPDQPSKCCFALRA